MSKEKNTGNFNTSHYNTGDCNTGNFNTGDCNTTEPTVRLFNKDSGIKFNDEIHRRFRYIIKKYTKLKCVWVYENNMSDSEKKENMSYKKTGGYLKINRNIYTGELVNDDDRKFLESLPNFCPKILEETTGITFKPKKKVITIDGKDIVISAESFDELKKQLLD